MTQQRRYGTIQPQRVTLETLQIIEAMAGFVNDIHGNKYKLNIVKAAMLKAYELGFPITSTLEYIDIMPEGPTLSGRGIMALLQQYSDVVRMTLTRIPKDGKHYGSICTIERLDNGFKYAAMFTMDDAARAGLINKQAYKQYPGDMTDWRSISNCAKIAIPDLMGGLGLSYERDQHLDNVQMVTASSDGKLLAEPPLEFDLDTGLIFEEAKKEQ